MLAGNRGDGLSVFDRKEGTGFLHRTKAITVQEQPSFLTMSLASLDHVATPVGNIR